MSKKTFDWIRYDGVFIKVRKLPGGGYHAIVTEVMPDYPVRDMLVAATFEGTFIEKAPAVLQSDREPTLTQKELKQIANRKKYAEYSWPLRAFLHLIEFILYIAIGSLFVAVPLGILAGIGWLIGKAFGAL